MEKKRKARSIRRKLIFVIVTIILVLIALYLVLAAVYKTPNLLCAIGGSDPLRGLPVWMGNEHYAGDICIPERYRE